MDRDKKKRGIAEANSDVERGKLQSQERTAIKKKMYLPEITDIQPDDSYDSIENPSKYRQLGVFEFPWLNEVGSLAPELDGCSLRDVFFSSLVDGCSAAIGLPGDRISTPRASLIVFPGEADSSSPSDGDAEGADCIWSCALRQPLSAAYCRSSST